MSSWKKESSQVYYVSIFVIYVSIDAQRITFNWTWKL